MVSFMQIKSEFVLATFCFTEHVDRFERNFDGKLFGIVEALEGGGGAQVSRIHLHILKSVPYP